MTIVTQKSLRELRERGVNCNYALSPNKRDLFLTSTGKTYGEAFDNFVDVFEEECKCYDGVCEVRESDENKEEGLIRLIGRIITVDRTP